MYSIMHGVRPNVEQHGKPLTLQVQVPILVLFGEW